VFPDPKHLRRFVADLSAELEAVGFANAAKMLNLVNSTAFTTSSEWLGELGTTVKRIRVDVRVPRELDVKLDRIMVAVRRAWPEM
jgi:hypothetical protein